MFVVSYTNYNNLVHPLLAIEFTLQVRWQKDKKETNGKFSTNLYLTFQIPRTPQIKGEERMEKILTTH